MSTADAIVYGMGSFYTSICPSLVLDGLGEAVAARHVPKVLLLNGSHDRETASALTHGGPMTAVDMVQAVADALNMRYSRRAGSSSGASASSSSSSAASEEGEVDAVPPGRYVNALLVPRGGDVAVDAQRLRALGVGHIEEVESTRDESGRVLFEPAALVAAIGQVLAVHRAAAAGGGAGTVMA